MEKTIVIRGKKSDVDRAIGELVSNVDYEKINVKIDEVVKVVNTKTISIR